MPTSPYINQSYRPTQDLFEDLTVESIRVWGRDLLYIPRDLVHEDLIMGEDIASKFSNAYWIESYLKNVDNYDGQGDLFQKFGVEIRDEATFIITKRSFNHILSSTPHNSLLRPREGDLVFEPNSSALFEITFVEHEKPFYQLNNLPVYELVCSLFQYGGEDIDTDIVGLDVPSESQSKSIEAEKYTVIINLSASRKFLLGETLSQTQGSGSSVKTISGEIARIENNGTKFTVNQVKSTEDGEYNIFGTGTVTGGTSGLTGTITSVTWHKDDFARNDELKTEGESKIVQEENAYGYDL